MEVVLRRATAEDEPLLASIERECFSNPHWTADDFAKYESTVAEVDGTVVGFAVKHVVFGGGEADFEYEILNLAVLPLYRGLGLGRALLQAQLEPPGIYFLEVRESNVAARTLYSSLGFEEVGRRPNYYRLPDETAIVMRVKRC